MDHISRQLQVAFSGSIFVFGARFTEKIPKNWQLGFFLGVQLLCYVVILSNLPADSTIEATFDDTCVFSCISKIPKEWPAVLSAVFMGLSDAGKVQIHLMP